jgi:transposase
MASSDYWAEAPMIRQQRALFAPSLDATIAADDPVRLVDEILAKLDWSEWEAFYHGPRGQPPIHPRVIAGALLYGLCRGLRSTRKLEEACCYRVDFMWLVEGRRIDHTTFAKFRTRFGKPLKGLFRQLVRVAMTMGLVRLGDVAFDATRVKAYNSRYRTRTAATLEEKLAALDAQFEQMLAEWDASEQQATLAGETSPTSLPPSLADLDDRRQQMRAALEKVQELDAQRRREGVDPQKNPAQVPISDPESRVMPNKEGGYAPNYTPVATTDGERGFIVDGEVLNVVNETAEAAASVDRIREQFGETPVNFLTDSGNASGLVQQAMEERGVTLYVPTPEPCANPAQRDDLTQAVPEAQWSQLPLNSQQRLDKSCFRYDAAQDRYYCPLGQPLEFAESKPEKVQGQRVQKWIYECQTCAGCPLAARCISPQSKGGRTITRDEFEEVRERTAARMQTAEAKALYNQRPRIAETTFGILKSVFGLRQFLLRGLEKVKLEWNWALTAFNLKKLVREIARLRAQFAREIAAATN